MGLRWLEWDMLPCQGRGANRSHWREGEGNVESVGSKGGSYDAIAEASNSLHKTELGFAGRCQRLVLQTTVSWSGPQRKVILKIISTGLWVDRLSR